LEPVAVSQIDEFLEAARQEGIVESSGRFSLDTARAERYLSQYQLVDKHYYLLKLVQFAVQAGADEIQFEIARDSVQATIIGCSLERFDTKDVLATMLQQRIERRGPLKSLSIAIAAASALDPISVDWSAWNAYHQERLIMDEQGCKLQKLSRPPFSNSNEGSQIRSGYLFRMSRKPLQEEPPPPPKQLSWLDQLRQYWKGQCSEAKVYSHEHQLLSTKCQFAPILVKLDGRTLNSPSDFIPAKLKISSRMLELSILDGSLNSIGLPDVAEQEQIVNELAERVTQVENENGEKLSVTFGGEWRRGFLRCVVPFAIHRNLAGHGYRLIVIHFGVTILEKAWSNPWLVSSAGLDLDICEQSIVQNEKFEQRILLIEQLIECLCKSGSAIPPVKIPRLTSHELTEHVIPIHQRLHISEIPSEAKIEIQEIQGWVRAAISHKNRKCRLLLPQVNLAELKSPNNIWPAKPEHGPDAWSRWLRGAIRTVIEGDHYTFRAADLPGPWKPLNCLEDLCQGMEDSVYATFWPDGQLHQLFYAQGGRAIGWVLTLETDTTKGSLTRDGQTLEYGDPALEKPWAVWVQDSIEAIYLQTLEARP
jgi:hypothetical protein